MFYTYAHYKPDNSMFYIGKGKGVRAWNKINRSKKWKELVSKKGGFKAEILAYWDTEKEALEHEKVLISCFRDMKYELVNVADGGYGNSGFKMSEESKEKMKISHTGEKNHFYGKNHSEDVKLKISETKKKSSIKFWLGKPRLEETRKKISESLMGRVGRKHTEESKQKISLAHKGKKQLSPSEETRKKLSEATKNYWALKKLSKGNIQ